MDECSKSPCGELRGENEKIRGYESVSDECLMYHERNMHAKEGKTRQESESRKSRERHERALD